MLPREGGGQVSLEAVRPGWQLWMGPKLRGGWERATACVVNRDRLGSA